MTIVTESAENLTMQELWAEYRRTREIRLHNRLVEHYMRVVRYQATCLWRRVGPGVELDDLMQSGVLGLREAIAGFDPERGAKFETYCVARVRGAMLDTLRGLINPPRLARRRAKRLAAAAQTLQGKLGRPPTMEEMADQLQASREDMELLRQSSTPLFISSLPQGSEGAPGAGLDEVADPRAVEPQEAMQLEDLRELLLRALSRTERLIMILYYYEELSMREIGEVLGFTESRISQIHASVRQRLRERLSRRVAEAQGVRGISTDI